MDGAHLPSNVARFEQLMYLSIAIGVIGDALEWNQLVRHAASDGAGTVLLVEIAEIASMVFVIRLIARRHNNWARWLLLIVSLIDIIGEGILGIFFAAIVGAETYARLTGGVLATVVSTIQNLVQMAALWFVFTGNARDWFKRLPSQ